ncbi:hypothetical protein LTR66_005148 [Elasticomyces elasticus]|nr:hypothetical protein LTR66_005148 [Elasticomyces elasticus]
MLPSGANFWCDSSREAFTLAGASLNVLSISFAQLVIAVVFPIIIVSVYELIAQNFSPFGYLIVKRLPSSSFTTAFSSSALHQTKPSEAQDYADEEYLRTEERQKLATLKERLAEAREYLTYIEQHIDDLEREDKDAERERLRKEKAGSK